MAETPAGYGVDHVFFGHRLAGGRRWRT